MKNTSFTKIFLISFVLLLLAGCGGSSNGGENNATNGSSNWDEMTWDQDNWG